MKKYLLFAISFFVHEVQTAQNLLAFNSKKEATISFTENKGQIGDQYYQKRSDVLFGGSANNMIFFIKNSGVSYQLNKVKSYKDELDVRSNKMEKKVDELSIYRIDLNWKNCNSISNIIKENESEEFSNFYTSACPTGVIGVKSYKDVVLKNIYNNIDLHYYEKDGNLKYDYIVAPNANYKQIEIEVKGATIELQTNGGILLKTSFGEIEEGAPVVFQNGKTLKSTWVIKNNSLSFNIENYNPKLPLLIDPATRVWGTYYGGSGNDVNEYCSTDSSGFVYATGQTQSANLIATTGAYQTTINSSSDAYLVKFSPSGSLKWGTYYGGTSGENAFSCNTDKLGNVYLVGNTNSSAPANIIATPGAHQVSFLGGTDAFIAKFDSLGVRQWGTYYGGSSFEYFYSCAIDPFGDIYVSGTTDCNCSLISTPGCHQPSLSGSSDCFLVKFNSAGVRQWATYYGGTGNEVFSNCTTDNLGNVYLAGGTTSTNNISSPGSYQATFNNSAPTFNGFLAKFNSAGVRQWGTYYGGASGARIRVCASNKLGNITIAGDLFSGSTTSAIASVGCHQPVYGGGASDGFLANFNTSGQKLWGTYYGGSGDEGIYACSLDSLSNIYISGTTTSTNNISSAGNHQTVSGGLQDALLAKFNSSGVRQFATYYGGAGADYGEGCGIDNLGNVYLSGYSTTNSGTVIATPGSYQAVASSTCDVYVAKFNLCSGNTFTASYTPTLACSSQTVKVTATGVDTYTILPENSTFTSTVIITPTASAIYTIDGAVLGCNSSSSTTLNINVNTSPTITANSTNTLVCAGETVTLSASGASTYTWNPGGNGSSISVSPTVNSNYTVSGTDVNGCMNSSVFTQSVSLCTGVTKLTQLNFELSIYPNPFNNKIIISSDATKQAFQIFNVLGSVILNSVIENEITEIDLSNQCAGIYFVKIGSITKKIIKE